MAKNPEITDEIKVLIAKLHARHPKWTNKEIRNWVVKAVHDEDPSLPKGWPSRFAIDRIMPGIRDLAKRGGFKPNPIDRPWTIQSMGIDKYRIPPEALPAVLQVWFLAKQKRRTFTIRDAQWAGRLYAAVTDIEALFQYSFLASTAELWAARAGIEEFMGHEAANAYILSTMTGRSIDKEDAERFVGIPEEIRPQTMRMDPWVKTMIDDDVPKGYWDFLKGDAESPKGTKPNRRRGKK